jgi:hypothetical protein
MWITNILEFNVKYGPFYVEFNTLSVFYCFVRLIILTNLLLWFRSKYISRESKINFRIVHISWNFD